MNSTTEKTPQKPLQPRNGVLTTSTQLDKDSIQRVLKKRKDEQARLINEAKQYLDRLGTKIQGMTAFVYGSVARGDFHLGSDVDVVVISDELPTDIKARINFLYEPIPGIVEPKGYRREEFVRMLRKRHPTASGVLQDGILIRDDGFGGEMRHHISNLSSTK